MFETTDISTLKQYKKIKKELAVFMGIQEKHAQICAIELMTIAKANSDTLSDTIIYNYVVANPSSVIAKLIDPSWTEEYTKAFFVKVLDQLPFLIDEFNAVYQLSRSSKL